MEKMIRKVYIVSGSSHDFSQAEKFGELVYLSKGPMNRYAVNNMYRQFYEILKDSLPEDYLLICGLAVMNGVAASILAIKHHKINYLLYEKGGYLERNVVLFQDESILVN